MKHGPAPFRPEPKEPKPRNYSRITIPERCHPLAKHVFAEMARQFVTYDELARKSGVLRSTFKAWRTNNRPGLDTVEAALGALGWKLIPVPEHETAPISKVATYERLPEPVRAALDKIGGEWGQESDEAKNFVARIAWAALFAIAHEASPEMEERRKHRASTLAAMRISEPITELMWRFPRGPRNSEELADMLGIEHRDLRIMEGAADA